MPRGAHKSDCRCPLCTQGRKAEDDRRAAEREQLEAERRQLEILTRQKRDRDRFSLLVAARMMNMPAAEALHALAALARGTELEFDPENVLRGADLRARGPAGSWSPGELADRRPAQVTSSFWERFPEHSEHAAARSARREQAMVSRERAAADPVLAHLAQPSGVLWQTRGGALAETGAVVLGAAFGERGQPVQVSRVNPDVPELGSEPA